MTHADYASAFKRRFELDPAVAAVLVIDLQYASGSRHHGLGTTLAAEGKQASGQWRFDRISDVVVPNLQRLLDGCRARGILVVYLTLGSATGDFTDIPPYLRDLVVRSDNRAGTHSHEVLAEVAPRQADLVVNKTTASAFLSGDLDQLLRQRGIHQVLLTGVSTNSCVESTGRDAADLGYSCVLVEDCCSCANEELHRAAVTNFDRLFGRIATTNEVLAEVGAGRPACAP